MINKAVIKVCSILAILSTSVLAKEGSVHAANPLARMSGLLIAANDGFYDSTSEPLKKEVNQALEKHRGKFGKYKVGKLNVLAESWDSATKQGKVAVEATFERGADVVYLYYKENADSMMVRASLRYLAFASQTSEKEADAKMGPINRTWSTKTQL